ncbi:substrate-binding domain-containing protein [Arthrobacter sp. M4]|uniref:substrate-binding domain-containing protein n=1 Tax=Arthrobacter sp. M4 TaxID=218160 RepID=UPI001CDD23DF|nr:substrate-binding domain-containing protein [Arthrobacter sp. M4]MCA4132244.1 substrate-binding domain-containing protein [Arthrobacter sp. M4]
MDHRSIRMAIACAVASTLALSGCAGGSSPGDVRGALTAIGSGSQGAAIQAWRQGWAKEHPATSLNFSPDGNDVGVSALASAQAYFAPLDTPLTSSQVEATKKVCGPDGAFFVPVTLIPVGVAFNLPSVKNLRLNPAILAGIFTGRITRWDDAEIARLNPKAELPDKKIVPVTAKESSVLTSAATGYLNRSQDWGTKASLTWPESTRSSQVSKYADIPKKVDDTAGSIAFLDKSAIGSRFDTALLPFGADYMRMTNDAVARSVDASTVTETAGGIQVTMNDAPADGYPLAAVGYQAFCSSYKNESLKTLVKSWAGFVLGAGQSNSNYFAGVSSPSEEALKKARKLVDGIEVRP